ncbi:MAG: hypothetical protein ABI837_08255 [Acidobacteriota bacterium]
MAPRKGHRTGESRSKAAVPELYPPFDPHVTVLNLLFMTGPRAGEYLKMR